MAVGQGVRAERSRRGMTRRALAYHAGISERYLSDLERGRANVSLQVLFKVAAALGLPAWSLLPDAPLAREGGAVAPSTAEYRSIALVGLRGGGKTTLGEALAAQLGFEFFRLGDVIETLGGMSQGELISLAGQRAYRRVEMEAVTRVINERRPVVLETGGSLVSESETYGKVLNNFLTVWIRAEPEDHMQRVIDQGDLRPISGNRAAMADLNIILRERDRDYRRAHCELMTSGQTVDASVNQLMRLAGAHGFKVSGSRSV